MIISLLDVIKNKIGYNKEIYTKNYKSIQKESSKRTLDVVLNNLDKPLVSKRLFVNHCLISKTKEIDIHNKVKTFTDEELFISQKEKEIDLINFDSYKDNLDTNIFTLFPYSGGKQKHKELTQDLVNDMLSKNQIDTYNEPFLGGFGSVYNSLPILLKNGVNDIQLSDINQTIIDVFRQVKNNYKSVQYQLSQIFFDYYKEFGTIGKITREQEKSFFYKLRDELNQLEIDRKCNSRRTSLFLFLQHNSMGGMCEYKNNKTTQIQHGHCDSDTRTVYSKINLIINKVQIFNQILNITNITFKTRKYQNVLKSIDSKNTLVLLDPPYMDSKHLYGNDGFNHKELLTYIKNSKCHFIHFNNHNDVLENFSNENDFKYFTKKGIYSNSQKNKVSNECVMYSQRHTRRVQSSNIRLIRNRFINSKSINNKTTQYRKVS